MFEKDRIAIDLGATNMKIMVGNKKEVKLFGTIETPEGSINDDKIVNLEEIKKSLQSFLKKNNVRTKEISFTIHGQDVISRHTELPILDDNGIRTSLEWEMNQYLPKDISEYTVDYEIIERVDTLEKKALRLLVAAVPKEKVNQLVKLAEILGMEITAIDINANCACRVFREYSKKNSLTEGIGVIDLGTNNTNIIILDKGKLFIEREIPFGTNNIIKEIIRKENLDIDKAKEYLEKEINIFDGEEGTDIEKKILNLFDNVFSSLEKIVTFYTIGKSKNNLDEIYLIGNGKRIKGLDKYASNYFNSKVSYLDKVDKIGMKIKLSNDCDINQYIGTLGLLLRRKK